ncbi:FtsK/SpoIIIE family DNA translocase [Paenibacillus protaetiae]|uniref:DNA translocase FtsK n=1 Tax=Paenibacillus protaetiae TaxID=2509456 RepID=A0A4V0YEW7_9BACL|nr:DNA translocase FtsK [Paenibacillus protaetiae]QAY65651.1 DNA translocase FtsK [Paenibacillus protaetiae]
MAKKRKRKKSIAGQLKYEVYGILLITISIIALSGEAAVGRSLSKLFGLVLGKFYFVIAIVGIVVGLAVMVKRKWPRGWTQRRTGVLVFVLALTLMSSMAEIDHGIRKVSDLTGSIILNELSSNLHSELIESDPGDYRTISEKSISGGYVGAIEYSLLFTLFGYFGSKLIMYVMMAISIMLMTGKSYVELARMIKKRGARMYKLIHTRIANRHALKAASRSAAAKSSTAAGAVHDDSDIDDEEDTYTVLPPRRKKSLFFSWITPESQEKKQADGDASDEWDLEEESKPDMRLNGNSWKANPEIPWEKTADEGYLENPQVQLNTHDQELPPPWEDAHDAYAAYVPAAETGPEPPSFYPDDERDSGTEHGMAEDNAQLMPGNGMNEDDADLLEDFEESIPEPFDADKLSAHEDIDPNRSSAGGTDEEEGGHLLNGDAAVPPKPKPYALPSFTLLTKPRLTGKGSDKADMTDSRRKLEATLESFGVRARVLDVVPGPAVTRYEVQPATGVKVSRIVGLTDDIALALAAKDIRMEAPIPGKSAIGIEVPNGEVSVVTMREVMETPEFQNATSKLSIAFGKDIAGTPIIGNLAKMPHLLVAGATGSGKSVCINGIITSILYKAKPDEVKFLMVDPKMVELNMYNGIPHLLAPVVTNPRRASMALKKIVVEMEKRYELFSKSGTRNIEGYNTLMVDNPSAVLPYIVVIVDELADLMMVAAGDVEDSIARLAQMARAAGIHLIIATQRPSVDVITGVIKANIPSRIAFGVSSAVDSRTILDTGGAEKLLGRGDMLYLPVGMSKPIRVQGAFLSDQEVEAVVAFTSDQAKAEFKEDLVPELEEDNGQQDELLDELYDQAVQIVVEAKQASVSLLQRRMRIGYTRAARLVDQMEARGVVGPYEGSKPREVLMSEEQLNANKISS